MEENVGRIPRRRRVRLLVEYLLLFHGAVGMFLLAGSPGGPIPPLLLLAGVTGLVLRRDPTFDRAVLTRFSALRSEAVSIVVLWVIAAVTAVVALAVLAPHQLFDLPREMPLLWLVVIVFYPLLSVYPQELIYRAFLLHRYGPVFGRPDTQVAAMASAAPFGFTHLMFGSLLSVLLTLIGGWLFAPRYQRTRSLVTYRIPAATQLNMGCKGTCA